MFVRGGSAKVVSAFYVHFFVVSRYLRHHIQNGIPKYRDTNTLNSQKDAHERFFRSSDDLLEHMCCYTIAYTICLGISRGVS